MEENAAEYVDRAYAAEEELARLRREFRSLAAWFRNRRHGGKVCYRDDVANHIDAILDI